MRGREGSRVSHEMEELSWGRSSCDNHHCRAGVTLRQRMGGMEGGVKFSVKSVQKGSRE